MNKILKATQIILLILLVVVFIDISRIAWFTIRDTRDKPVDAIEIQTPIDAEHQVVVATLTDVTATEATITDANTTEEVTMEEVTTEEPEEEELPVRASIEMELVYQHPELPTGCESVALTMLLKYYGFELEKTTIASEYLVYSDNFVDGYVGNPFSSGGAGIYAPGLTKTANKYLNDQDTTLNAKNISDSSPETLYKYIANNTPVVIWNTVYMLYNNPSGDIRTYGAKEYQWDRNEHCMVLSGYDLEKNIVIVHDPIEGIVERDADAFWERYRNLGSMALIIR